MVNSPLWFFLPALDGTVHSVLQIVFAAVFLFAIVVTPRMVARSARTEHWERRRLAIEGRNGAAPVYGSAEELSAAVATPAERWGDILPSLLLVFGLLGTFIGLGLALTEAAGVLGGGNDALSGLTPIMDSLGSKFKTSTWGIIAFLSLKVWFMVRPYEEERLIWAGQQIELRLQAERSEREKHRAAEWQRMIDAVDASSARQLEAQQQAAGLAEERHREALAAITVTLQQIVASGHEQVELAKTGVERLDGLVQHTEANRIAMDSFVHGVKNNITAMDVAANNMAQAAEGTGKASQALGVVIGDMRNAMIDVLGEVRSGLTESIQGMDATFTTNMQSMSANLTRATEGIEGAISHLSTGVNDTIKKLEEANQDAVRRQASAQATFAASGDQLMSSLNTMQSFVEEMQLKTQTGLTSVATAGQKMADVSQRILNLDKSYSESNAKLEAMVSSVKSLVDSVVERSRVQEEAGMRHERQLEGTALLVEKIDMLRNEISRLVEGQSRALGNGDEGRQRLQAMERHVAAILAALTDTQEVAA
jgi:hypothetical protein